MDDDRRGRGVGVFGGVVSAKPPSGMRAHIASDAFGRECATWAADFAFGTVWTRDGLDRKLRSCVVLGILMALRQPEEIGYHVRIALANGLSIGELEEILYLAVPYAGVPAAHTAQTAMREALRDIAQEDDAAV